MDRPYLPRLVQLALFASALSVLGCGGLRSGVQSEPISDEVRKFRATHIECNSNHFTMPCQIGPDGKLYRYNPGEKGYGNKN